MSGDQNNFFRYIPAVDDLLGTAEIAALLQRVPRAVVLGTIREEVAALRRTVALGQVTPPAGADPGVFFKQQLLEQILAGIQKNSRPGLRQVLNLTGVVLHTNLGRAVLAEEAILAIQGVARGYANLEMDLTTGKRGTRYAPLEELLVTLTGAQAALVVNNNAAAVLLSLSTLAQGREVIVSRGQLVEIGGSFRIPDVMVQSGARLVEVGTTNKTYLSDYSRAITPDTALLLNVHTSNYRILGFTRETSIAELVSLGQERDLPVMCDLGSGSLVESQTLGLPPEPTAQEAVKAGASVVTFSGDKLLGGPQAGIIVGQKKYIDKMKQNPLTRALRIDKSTVAALEATLQLYLDPEKALIKIPTLAMLTAKPEASDQKAQLLCGQLHREAGSWADFNIVEVMSTVGGGALPTAQLPSRGVEISPRHISSTALAAALRETEPAVVGRLHDDKLILDVRTLQTGEEEALVRVLVQVLKQGGQE